MQVTVHGKLVQLKQGQKLSILNPATDSFEIYRLIKVFTNEFNNELIEVMTLEDNRVISVPSTWINEIIEDENDSFFDDMKLPNISERVIKKIPEKSDDYLDLLFSIKDSDTLRGDIVRIFIDGEYDVLFNPCDCFNNMSTGLPLAIKSKFPDAFVVNCTTTVGDINKLGSYTTVHTVINKSSRFIVNAYTHFNVNAEIDYVALALCLRKVNHNFNGKHILMPQLGVDNVWSTIKKIIEREFTNVKYTVVTYDKSRVSTRDGKNAD